MPAITKEFLESQLIVAKRDRETLEKQLAAQMAAQTVIENLIAYIGFSGNSEQVMVQQNSEVPQSVSVENDALGVRKAA